MKRTLIILMALTMIVFINSLTYANDAETFGDLSGHWATPYIDKAIKDNIYNHKDIKNTHRFMNREEMSYTAIVSLGLLEPIPNIINESNILKSIRDYSMINDFYKDSVIRAYTVGLLEGFEDLHFKPKNTLTRAEAAVVVARVLGLDERKPFGTDDRPSLIIPYMDYGTINGEFDLHEYQMQVYALEKNGAYDRAYLDLYLYLNGLVEDRFYLDRYWDKQVNPLKTSITGSALREDVIYLYDIAWLLERYFPSSDFSWALTFEKGITEELFGLMNDRLNVDSFYHYQDVFESIAMILFENDADEFLDLFLWHLDNKGTGFTEKHFNGRKVRVSGSGFRVFD